MIYFSKKQIFKQALGTFCVLCSFAGVRCLNLKPTNDPQVNLEFPSNNSPSNSNPGSNGLHLKKLKLLGNSKFKPQESIQNESNPDANGLKSKKMKPNMKPNASQFKPQWSIQKETIPKESSSKKLDWPTMESCPVEEFARLLRFPSNGNSLGQPKTRFTGSSFVPVGQKEHLQKKIFSYLVRKCEPGYAIDKRCKLVSPCYPEVFRGFGFMKNYCVSFCCSL